MPGEKAGNIPTRAWLDARYGKDKWGAGSVLNFAIGQGEVLATPLQMAVALCGNRQRRHRSSALPARPSRLGRSNHPHDPA